MWGLREALHLCFRRRRPLDYFRFLLLPLLSGIGVRVEIEVVRRGYYPPGGGQVVVEVEPSRSLRPLVLDEPGHLSGIRGFAHISNLPAHIVHRMASEALAELADFPMPPMALTMLGSDKAIGAGGAILLASMEYASLGASAIAQKGVGAEQLGSAGGRLLREELLSGATLDIHAADQVLVYLALAGGTSSFLARDLSSHAATAIWLLEQFLPVRFRIGREAQLVRITTEQSG